MDGPTIRRMNGWSKAGTVPCRSTSIPMLVRSTAIGPSRITAYQSTPNRQIRKRRSSVTTPARPSRTAVMAMAATTNP